MVFNRSTILAVVCALASSASAYNFTWMTYFDPDLTECDPTLLIESGKFYTGTKAAPACLDLNTVEGDAIWARIILSPPMPPVRACNLTAYTEAGCPSANGRLIGPVWPNEKRCSMIGDWKDEEEITPAASMQIACDVPASFQVQYPEDNGLTWSS